MNNKEYDANVWKEIEEFYGKLSDDKKIKQDTWEVEIKDGEKTTFYKLSEDPKQRLAALFLSSYLSTTWHKITLTEEQRNELLCDNNIKDNAAKKIEEYIKAKESEGKKSDGLEKLKDFWESVIKFLGHLELKEYDFSKEQTANFEKLNGAVEKIQQDEDEKKTKTYKNFIYESAVEPYHTILNLQKVINGFGIALACDFLKEAHFCNIAKPDVHICHTFSVIDGISYSMDLALVKRVAEFANNVCKANKDDFCNSGAYYVDKVIWKICKEDSLKKDSLKKDLLEKLADLRKNYQEGEVK